MASAALRTLLKAPLQGVSITTQRTTAYEAPDGTQKVPTRTGIRLCKDRIQPGNTRRFCCKLAPASVLRCVASRSANQKAMHGRLSAVQMPAVHMRPVSMEVLIMHDGSRGSPLVLSDGTGYC